VWVSPIGRNSGVFIGGEHEQNLVLMVVNSHLVYGVAKTVPFEKRCKAILFAERKDSPALCIERGSFNTVHVLGNSLTLTCESLSLFPGGDLKRLPGSQSTQ
jgi:hypothetical protein